MLFELTKLSGFSHFPIECFCFSRLRGGNIVKTNEPPRGQSKSYEGGFEQLLIGSRRMTN